MRKNKVLLVEDDSTLSFIIEDALVREGFDVITASDGEDGLRKFGTDGPDIVVADVMMPKLDGFSMVKLIRAQSPAVPVLFLTARTSIYDLLHGFELGANDYIRKPFQIAELLVRIKALLRRNATLKEQRILTVGDCMLDLASQKLRVGDAQYGLSHIEALILDELFNHTNEVVEARALMFRVWQNDDYNNLNRIHGFIYKLRKYLTSSRNIDILNVRGIGYKLSVKA